MVLDYVLMGERLREARKNKKLSQVELSEKLDVSVAFLSRIEKGTSQINLKRLVEICDMLDIDAGETISGIYVKSKQYLNRDLYNILISCSPEKQKLIYQMAQLVSKSEFV